MSFASRVQSRWTKSRLGTLLLLLLTAPLMATKEPSFRTLLKGEDMEIRV